MKYLMPPFVALSLMSSVTLFAAEPINLSCRAVKTKHRSIRTFVIANIAGAMAEDPYRHGADLTDRDTRQHDTARTKDGVISLSLTNGCDNSYEFDFSETEYKELLAGTRNEISVRLDYVFISEIKRDQDLEGVTAGKLTAICKKQ